VVNYTYTHTHTHTHTGRTKDLRHRSEDARLREDATTELEANAKELDVCHILFGGGLGLEVRLEHQEQLLEEEREPLAELGQILHRHHAMEELCHFLLLWRIGMYLLARRESTTQQVAEEPLAHED
jgi:hypothetical protein